MTENHNEGNQKDMKHQDDLRTVKACDTVHLPTRKTESDEPTTEQFSEPCTHDIMEEATENSENSKSPIRDDIEAQAINNGYITILPSNIKVGECCTQNQEETLKNEDSEKEQPEMKIPKLKEQLCQRETPVFEAAGYVIMQPKKIQEFSTNSNMSYNHNKDRQENIKHQDNLHTAEASDTVHSPTSKTERGEPISDAFSKDTCYGHAQVMERTSDTSEYSKSSIHDEMQARVKLALEHGYINLPPIMKVPKSGASNSYPFSETCSKDLGKTTETTEDSESSILKELEAKVIRAIEHGYIVLPSNTPIKVVPEFRPSNTYINSSRLILQKSDAYPYATPKKTKASTVDMPPNNLSQLNLNGSEQHSSGGVKSGKDKSLLTAQEELAEIFNDYKNNVHSISEVEKLVKEWRKKNETPQSLKECQEQLNKMREDYAAKQLEIGRRAKQLTLFEILMRFFCCRYT